MDETGKHLTDDVAGQGNVGLGGRSRGHGLQCPESNLGTDEQQGAGELAAEGAVHSEGFGTERLSGNVPAVGGGLDVGADAAEGGDERDDGTLEKTGRAGEQPLPFRHREQRHQETEGRAAVARIHRDTGSRPLRITHNLKTATSHLHVLRIIGADRQQHALVQKTRHQLANQEALRAVQTDGITVSDKKRRQRIGSHNLPAKIRH